MTDAVEIKTRSARRSALAVEDDTEDIGIASGKRWQRAEDLGSVGDRGIEENEVSGVEAAIGAFIEVLNRVGFTSLRGTFVGVVWRECFAWKMALDGTAERAIGNEGGFEQADFTVGGVAEVGLRNADAQAVGARAGDCISRLDDVE